MTQTGEKFLRAGTGTVRFPRQTESFDHIGAEFAVDRQPAVFPLFTCGHLMYISRKIAADLSWVKLPAA